ncbi:MAG: NAD-dependent epimerase/dehydratase family protein [Polyangiales bacterium]
MTGATGFLGSHLVASLLEHGHEVVALARNADGLPGKSISRRGDVMDEASIRDAAAGCAGIFHCAGFVSRKAEDAEELQRVHVKGTRNVIAAAKAAKVKRLVHASTSGTVAVSDDPDHIATEDGTTPIGLINRWPYYRAKLFAEQAALEANGPELEVVCVNPTLLLGPGDVRGSSTEDVRLFLEKKIPAVPPGGMSYVDARDAAEAMRLAMEKGTPGERYLVGAVNLTIKEFFGRLERLSGVKAPWIPVPRAPQMAAVGAKLLDELARKIGLAMPVDPISLDMAQYHWYLDASRAERVLGWQSRDPMTTLHDTITDLRARGVVWPDLDGPRITD